MRSPFGWHVLRVAGVEPGQSRPLEAVRDELRAALAQERAADLAFERANKVEDALAGGATLEEAAQALRPRLRRRPHRRRGQGPDGERVALPVIEAAREPLLRAVFAAEPGAAPRLKETEAGFVAVELREAAPPALRPFETVEAEVRAAFLADARRRAQEERAAALLAATRAGKSLAEAAREAGLGSREVGALAGARARAAPPGGAVPPELLAPLFELQARRGDHGADARRLRGGAAPGGHGTATRAPTRRPWRACAPRPARPSPRTWKPSSWPRSAPAPMCGSTRA